ncbi:MAG: hypothetical protein QW270_01410 [Candidatus Bathyarchaeia archaeon]
MSLRRNLNVVSTVAVVLLISSTIAYYLPPSHAESTFIFADDFNDNYLDSDKWEKVLWWTGDVSGDVYEQNQRLELYISDGFIDGIIYVGIGSKDKYNLTRGKISVYLANDQHYEWTALLISPQKITGGHIPGYPIPELNEFYTIMLRYHHCYVFKRVSSGDVQTLYMENWLAASNLLQITVEAGIIKLYEGDTCRYGEDYQLSSYECYIYIYSFNKGTSFLISPSLD